MYMNQKECPQCKCKLPTIAKYCRLCGRAQNDAKSKHATIIGTKIEIIEKQQSAKLNQQKNITENTINERKESNLYSIKILIFALIILIGIYLLIQRPQATPNNLDNLEKSNGTIEAGSKKPKELKKIEDNKNKLMNFEGRVAMNSGWGAVMQENSKDKGLILGFFDANTSIGNQILATCPINRLCKITAHAKPFKRKELEKDLTFEKVIQSYEIQELITVEKI